MAKNSSFNNRDPWGTESNALLKSRNKEWVEEYGYKIWAQLWTASSKSVTHIGAKAILIVTYYYHCPPQEPGDDK